MSGPDEGPMFVLGADEELPVVADGVLEIDLRDDGDRMVLGDDEDYEWLAL